LQLSFSDGHDSAAAPFYGDDGAFEQTDVLLQSPITSERVVDTQSGFLVVVKRLGERLALTCKRRVGTPPSSSILMTPDESVKLSRILASTLAGVEEPAPELFGGGRRRFGLSSSMLANRNEPFWVEHPRWTMAAVAALMIILGIDLAVGFVAGGRFAPSPALKVAQKTPTDLLDSKKVDAFCRTFVADMLDFDPDTYRASQIQAMSNMSPELLNKYWVETNFPLSEKQLKTLPQGTTVIITKIAQDRLDNSTSAADVFAEMVHPGNKVTSPVHLKLRLALASEGNIRVTEQQDLTANNPRQPK
jgi:hypothetical protein